MDNIGILSQKAHAYIGTDAEIIAALIYSVILLLAVIIIQWVIRKVVDRRVTDEERKRLLLQIRSHVLSFLMLAGFLNIWIGVLSKYASIVNVKPVIVVQLIDTLVIALFYVAARRAASLLFAITDIETSRHYFWAKAVNVSLAVLVGLLVFKIWVVGETNISTYLGLLSAGIAIALQDVIASAAGWVYIIALRPFKVGERIEVSNMKGDVVDQGVFQFSIMEVGNWVDADQPTGRIIHFPNSVVLKQSLANFSTCFRMIWEEIPVMITFESNWKQARLMLEDIAAKHCPLTSKNVAKEIKQAARDYIIPQRGLDPEIFVSAADSGVVLTLRYMVYPSQRRGVHSQLWTAILEGTAALDDVDFAYPTQRFYNNVQEGKSGTGGPPHHQG